MPRKLTQAEIFAGRIKNRFQIADDLIASDAEIHRIVAQTSKAIKTRANKDLPMLADALQMIANEVRLTAGEIAESQSEQEAAISHAAENRDLWTDWRNQAANDTMLVKELRDVWFKLSAEMMLDHVRTVEYEPLQSALAHLKESDPTRHALLVQLLTEAAD